MANMDTIPTILQSLTAIWHAPLTNFAQGFIQSITTTIDLIAIVIVVVSVYQGIVSYISQSVLPQMKITKSNAAYDNRRDVGSDLSNNPNRKVKQNFVSGLLFALELESANAILKLGLFTSMATGLSTSVTTTLVPFNIGNNFIFFVAVLSLRIAINQTLRRFSW
jgi:hypothetical protein